MPITTPPPAPNPLGTNFAAEALAFTQWMQAAAPEFNTAVNDANAAVGDAEQAVLDAAAQVGLATTQAGNASSSASTASGHAIAADNARAAAVLAKDAAEDARDMSQTYAALAGASAGLPALAGQALKQLQVKSDESGVQWVVPVAGAANIVRAEKTSAYTLTSADKGTLIDCTGTWTLGFDAAATLGAGWWCYVRNTSNGDITIDPSGAELIDGFSTLVMKPGFTYLLQCDGTAVAVVTIKQRTYDRRALITATGTFTVPADCFVIRPYAFGRGGDAVAVTKSGGGGGCAFGDVAVTPGQIVSLSIASGIATVTASAVAVLTANPAAGHVAGTASKDASVTNGGAYAGGTGVGNSGGASSGSPLGVGKNSVGAGGCGWGGSGGSQGGGGVVGYGAANTGGPGFDPSNPPTDPILFGLYGPGGASGAANSNGSDGGPGGGGGAAPAGALDGGKGGFGGGGGYAAVTGRTGGSGGFGGGGGQSATSGYGGLGGYGGGGGCGATGGTGGAAAIIIIY